MTDREKVAFCELESKGFQHEEVNAAVIKLVADKYSCKGYFFCEHGHYECVRKIIQGRSRREFPLIHRSIESPFGAKNESNKYYDLSEEIFSSLRALSITRVYFTNTHYSALRAIQRVSTRYREIKVTMIIHGQLNEHLEFSALKKLLLPKIWLINLLKQVGDSIDFYVVSGHIKPEMEKIGYKKLKVKTLHHPYLWNEQLNRGTRDSNKIRFCCIGSIHGNKGRKILRKLITDLVKTDKDFELTIFGNFRYFKSDPRIIIQQSRFSREELDREILKFDYILQPYEENSYRFKASGILFDAINYEIPIITTRNAFTEYYFKLLGGIGYLCSNYDELRCCVIDKTCSPNPDHIEKFQKNMSVAKKKLDALNKLVDL